MFDKAFRYQKQDSEVFQAAKGLSAFFEARVKEIENVSMKEVINKGITDPNNAAYGNFKFVT